ncbi:hypothetical protein E0H77_12525 [Acinetobacter sp. ANC 4633]|uniref:hypothetical protein n=1 Tax=Acinetobacter sp. ANC 4633 TaxID=2529845 RepID=UPI00103F19D8|nr:hypothetical protein [Acinetobacter sp. ANC 4633]TCB23939.1 hypothetical protein E0H77_12525 [Acinetobacter sp. ANC 4633]
MSSNPDTSGASSLGLTSSLSTQLMDLLATNDIMPGSSPSYQVCKAIYSYHPLGAKMAEEPIKRAQAKPREIIVDVAINDDLVKAFNQEWKTIGKTGADLIIRNVMRTSRIYGISSLAVYSDHPEKPIDYKSLYKSDISFNVLDPLKGSGITKLQLGVQQKRLKN